MNTQLLPYRLKTARRKKRLQKLDYDKQLLRFERRYKELRKPKEVIMEKLDTPYQKGWKRLFVLKNAPPQSDKAEFYQGILNKINRVQYHYDEKFRSRKTGRYRYIDFSKLPTLRPIHSYEWENNTLKLTDEQRACFDRVEYWNAERYTRCINYVFALPWLFEIKVLPHMIYEVKLGDALLAQEESFLNDYLYGCKPAGCRLAKIKGRRHNYRNCDYDEKSRFADPFKNRQIWDVLEECL